MKNHLLIYTLLIALTAFILMLWGISTAIPEQQDQTDSFSRHDKVMYGSFILYEMLGDIFPHSDMKESKESVYQRIYLSDNIEAALPEKVSYIFINNSLEKLSKYDIEVMLSFVESGRTVFLSTNIFPNLLTDALEIDVEPNRISQDKLTDGVDALGETALNRSPKFKSYFSSYHSLTTEILAYNHQQKPNLIKVKRGSGFFILSTTPHLFTNYYMLQSESRSLIEQAFSHLPIEDPIWWDEFYKVQYQRQRKLEESPLQYIYSQEALAWAFWLTVIGLIIYVLFESKRNQRTIPIIRPLPNATLAFAETIGRLYFESQDHKNIAEKKIKIFLAFIRTTYYLKTQSFTDEFKQNLSAKSGVERNVVNDLCELIIHVRRQVNISENELINLNTKIEDFYRHIHKQ